MFKFSGPILASKSWLNRLQVVQYFNPTLKISASGDVFQSDDVLFLQKAINGIQTTNVFDLGLGGTSLRFFVFLISRLEGEWIVKAAPRLWQRPQQELIEILQQLGVEASFESGTQMRIRSKGWRPSGLVKCSAKNSSQFVSGLLLSAWKLESDLQIEIEKPNNSVSYLQMTLDLLKKIGMQIETIETESALKLKILKDQVATITELTAEPDISSAFSLAAAALIDGDVVIENWVTNSSQPDRIFTELLTQMNVECRSEDRLFKITKHKTWNSVTCNLANAPDLFPVLAVLAAFGEGISVLYGASQLKLKESDRIAKTQELLTLAGFKCDSMSDGLKIYGQSSVQDMQKYFEFNPDHDHRMAMAAALLKLKGYNIHIRHPEVVNKSYPNFWKDIGL